MKLFGLATKSAVHYLYQKRATAGLLEKHGQSYTATDELIGIPLAQSIRAGFDAPARDANRYEKLNLHTHLIERPNSTFLLDVEGDSMIDAGIQPGDSVVVDRSLDPQPGDVVVAVIDDAYTLKFFAKDPEGRVCLLAGNRARYSEPFYPTEEMTIIGVVLSSFRKYR